MVLAADKKSGNVTDRLTLEWSKLITLTQRWRQKTSDDVMVSGGEKHAKTTIAAVFIKWL